MVLEWWFDVGENICQVHAEPRKSKLNIVFLGDFAPIPSEVKAGKNCITYIFATDEGDIKIHDLVKNGERFISLYFAGQLVREYNVRAETLAELYQKYGEDYDYPSKYIWKKVWLNAIISGFAAALVLVVFGLLLNLVRSPLAVTFLCVGVFAACLALITGLQAMLFSYRRKMMECYEIKSSILKKKSRKKRLIKF